METKKESDEAIRNVDKVNWENGRNNGEEKGSSDPLIFQSRKKQSILTQNLKATQKRKHTTTVTEKQNQIGKEFR